MTENFIIIIFNFFPLVISLIKSFSSIPHTMASSSNSLSKPREAISPASIYSCCFPYITICPEQDCNCLGFPFFRSSFV